MREGDHIWNLLKDRLQEFGLSGPSGTVFRTKADCLRLCREGPILLVYPEGTWYHRVDRAKLDRIIRSHLLKGHPLWDEAFARNPLPTEAPPQPLPRRASRRAPRRAPKLLKPVQDSRRQADRGTA